VITQPWRLEAPAVTRFAFANTGPNFLAVDAQSRDLTITPDGTNACSGLTTDNIMVRYQVSNTGTATLGQCTVTDSNPAFGTPAFTGQQLARKVRDVLGAAAARGGPSSAVVLQ